MKYWIPALIIILSACVSETKHDKIEKYKAEILEAEKEFSALLNEKGISTAFLTFAADDAVIDRGSQIIKGKEEMKAYFKSRPWQEVSLEWTPEYVDVSSSGDLGYTYGYYHFSAKDTTGIPVELDGVFHTVWKRQNDGSWKFVFD